MRRKGEDTFERKRRRMPYVAKIRRSLTTDHVGMYVGHQTLLAKGGCQIAATYEFLYLPAVKRVTFSSASFILGNCSCA